MDLDFLNRIAHIALLKWLKRDGVSRDDVSITTLPFPQLTGPLTRGQIDAAWLPEPYATQAVRRGAKIVAMPFDATCSKDCMLTAWMTRTNTDANLAARFRNAVQAAAVWANKRSNHPASARILAKYTGLDATLIDRTTRFKYATRLRLPMAQPLLDLYAEFDLIPDGMSAKELIR